MNRLFVKISSLLQQKPLVAALIAIACLVMYRVSVLIQQPVPVFFDESYYFFWSLTPDWGYFSKPPMVAWLIGLTTEWLPVAEWSLKLASPILYGLSALIIATIGSQLFDRRVGALAAILFITMPLVSFNSLFITTDAPLLFFWSLTVWLFINALEKDQWRYWLAAGITGGLGLLSKYTMILLPVCLVLYFALTPSQRAQLANPKLWVGFTLAALIYLPNLWWNAQNDFISFQHTREISQLDQSLLHLDSLLEFVGGQFFAFGLICMGFFVALVSRKSSYSNDKLRLLIALSLPYLTLFTLLAFVSRANQNWAAPVYITASIVAAYAISRSRSFWLPLALGLNLFMMLSFYHYHGVLSVAGVEANRSNDPYRRVLGWKEAGLQLGDYQTQYPKAYLLSDSRKLLAYLGFYASPRFDQRVAAWNPEQAIRHHYHLTSDLTQVTADEFIFVAEHPVSDEVLSHFEQAKQLPFDQIPVYKDWSRELFVYYVAGFKGYE